MSSIQAVYFGGWSLYTQETVNQWKTNQQGTHRKPLCIAVGKDYILYLYYFLILFLVFIFHKGCIYLHDYRTLDP